MTDYPATEKKFKVNGKEHTMFKFTLGLQSRLEDENISVSYLDILQDATDMTDEDISGLRMDQIEILYKDISDFTYEESGDNKHSGSKKKP
jgi:hypothetical protein